METMTNSTCKACTDTFEGINGTFCIVLKRYVEHDKKPKCNER